MWAAAAGMVLSAVGSAEDKKKDQKHEGEMTEKGALLQRQNYQFNSQMDDYYKQRDRNEKLRGLDEFRKFSTVKHFAPNYTDSTVGQRQDPVMPKFNEGAYAPKEKTGGGNPSFWERHLDPAGLFT